MLSDTKKIQLWSFLELQRLFSSISKEDAVAINKLFPKRMGSKAASITNFKQGVRAKPSTYDWRRDKEVILHLATHPKYLIVIADLLIERTSTLSTEEFQKFYANARNDAWRAPRAMVLKAMGELVEFEDFYLKIQDIRECLEQNQCDYVVRPITNAETQAFKKMDDKMKLEECLKILKQEEEEEQEEEAENAQTLSSSHEKPTMPSTEEGSMSLSDNLKHTQYLGYIRLQNGSFYNFYPTAIVRNNEVYSIPEETVKHQFPSYGAFALAKSHFRNSLTKNLIDNYYYLIAIDESDLENNHNDDYVYRLSDFQKIVQSGRFEPIEKIGAYFVVYPINANAAINDSEIDLNTSIYVSFTPNAEEDAALNYSKRIDVVLSYGDKFLGPTPLIQDAKGRYYVNFRSGSKNGEIECFEGKNLNQQLYRSMIFVHDADNGQNCYRDILLTRRSGVQRSVIDTYDDKTLLKRIAEQSRQFDKKTLSLVIEWLDKTALDTNLLGSNLDIQKSRRDRLKDIISNIQLNESNVEQFASVITSCLSLAKDDETGFFDKLTLRIAKNPTALENLKEYKAIRDQIDVLLNEKSGLEQSISVKREELSKIDEKYEKQKQAELTEQVNKLLQQRDEAKTQLDDLINSQNDVKNLAEVKQKLSDLKEEIRQKRWSITDYEKEIDRLSHTLIESVKDDKISKLAFTPALAHKFSEAAALWVSNKKEDELSKKEIVLNKLQMSDLSSQELVEYLYSATSKHRNYDRNTILNLYICLAQGFLTVFSGQPGCGKTSICNIISTVLGLNSYGYRAGTSLDINRFLQVSVERGWTSKRDFLGYYNPLSKTFETQDAKRHECFKLLDREAKQNRFTHPFIILLDEANLSQMEYYWADFMNICDNQVGMGSIHLGDGHRYLVPNTLRFLATINNDQTTEILSPRLIDRSWVVSLPKPIFDDYSVLTSEVTECNPKDDSIELVNWETFTKIFSLPFVREDVSRYDEKINTMMNSIIKLVKGLGINVSARSYRAMMNYIYVATYWFKSEDMGSSYTPAIDFAVAQKLLPCISCVGAQYETPLNELLNFCETNDLTKSAEILTDIITRGERAMHMYSFF
ncbi:hypothetical protein M3080_00430 [Parasutterella secunda]|uniref:hypothetical protein n=1 Tax=Parasutterella secunda TaxID=626947 RepID=UPI002010CB77|nr:hypothetical protein [Parasutterella secunda]MCL1595847.1 hypothetical protein [Parasutterella secunda]